jgi:hypothetical protein
MGNKVKINDESGDHKYFSLLPHYILNHSTAVDQALYMQMKRYTGEGIGGTCWASKRTLMKKLRVGLKAINKSLEYLQNRGWVKLIGKKEVETKGGTQLVDEYEVVDIWKINMDYYQGVLESTPLDGKGVLESLSRRSQKEDQGVLQSTPNKNHILNKNNNKEEITLLNIFNKEIQTENLKEKNKFLDYWTEKNIKGTKEKWQMEKTFDVKRRWSKWLDNIKEWSTKGKEEAPSTIGKNPYYGEIPLKSETLYSPDRKTVIKTGYTYIVNGVKKWVGKDDAKYINWK